MVTTSKGLRTGTRSKLKKEFRSKLKVTPYIAEFSKGQKVVFKPNPASQKGMPHSRFLGLMGVVRERRGGSYLVDVNVSGKIKTVISRPEHLKPAG